MQYTYEESVRELSDFIGKHVTADNYWKMEQVLLTVLNSSEDALLKEYDKGYDAGFCDATSDEDDPYSMDGS